MSLFLNIVSPRMALCSYYFPFSDCLPMCCVSSGHSVVRETLRTPFTVACEASLSLDSFQQEYWSGCWFSPGGLLHPGTKPVSCTGRQIHYQQLEPGRLRSMESQGEACAQQLESSPICYNKKKKTHEATETQQS